MNWLYLTSPLHQNHFEKSFSIPEDQLCNFLLSFEGGIQAVNAACVAPYLADEEIKSIRMGYKKAPRHIFVSNMDILFKTCSIMLALDQDEFDEFGEEDEEE